MAIDTIKAVAGKLNVVIEQGATFDVPLTWSDESNSPVAGLENYTARLHIRDSIDAASTLLELTTENGGLILGTAPGEVRLFISATDTAAISWTAGNYDLEMVSAAGVVTRLLKGNVKIDTEITR